MNRLFQHIKKLPTDLLALAQQADWALVLFLCGLVQIKLAVKLAAIVGYAVYAVVKKYFSGSRIPAPAIFYFAIPIVGLASAWLAGNFGYHNYLYAYAYTIVLWLAGGAGFLLLYYTTQHADANRMVNTVKLFVIINLLFCGYQFAMLCIQAHHPMPYWLHDKELMYGVSSGDRIYGLFMDSSHVNAAINGLLMLFFMFRQQVKWAAICALVIALCTSNLVFLLLGVLLIVSFFAAKDKGIKSSIWKTGVIYLVLYFIISPENIRYAAEMLNGKTKEKHVALPACRTTVSQDSIRADIVALKQQNAINRQIHPNQPLDTSYTTALIGKWYGPQIAAYVHQPLKKGKSMALIRTFNYAFSGIRQFALGAGPACFSSKTAFKITGLGMQGTYTDEKIFVARTFLENHLLIELCYLAKPVSYHSIANKPGSVYHQLLGEYGFVGLALFCTCYLYFFYRRSSGAVAKKMLLIALFLLLAVDYWFEMLSLSFIFEFLTLIPSTINQGNDATTSGHRVDAGL